MLLMRVDVLVDHRCLFIFATERVYMLEIVEILSVVVVLSLAVCSAWCPSECYCDFP